MKERNKSLLWLYKTTNTFVDKSIGGGCVYVAVWLRKQEIRVKCVLLAFTDDWLAYNQLWLTRPNIPGLGLLDQMLKPHIEYSMVFVSKTTKLFLLKLYFRQ